MRFVVPGVLLVVLVACASAGGGSQTSPPAAKVNDVAGKAVSYCWGTTCVDGFPSADVPKLATVGTLRFDQEPTEFQVFVRRGASPTFEQQPVSVSGGRLGAIPAGTWDYLVAMATFKDGSAMYAWRLP